MSFPDVVPHHVDCDKLQVQLPSDGVPNLLGMWRAMNPNKFGTPLPQGHGPKYQNQCDGLLEAVHFYIVLFQPPACLIPDFYDPLLAGEEVEVVVAEPGALYRHH